jgi:hypothetical protein
VLKAGDAAAWLIKYSLFGLAGRRKLTIAHSDFEPAASERLPSDWNEASSKSAFPKPACPDAA